MPRLEGGVNNHSGLSIMAGLSRCAQARVSLSFQFIFAVASVLVTEPVGTVVSSVSPVAQRSCLGTAVLIKLKLVFLWYGTS